MEIWKMSLEQKRSLAKETSDVSVLAKLSESCDDLVKINVINNPHITIGLLMEMQRVEKNLVENYGVSTVILKKINKKLELSKEKIRHYGDWAYDDELYPIFPTAWDDDTYPCC